MSFQLIALWSGPIDQEIDRKILYFDCVYFCGVLDRSLYAGSLDKRDL